MKVSKYDIPTKKEVKFDELKFSVVLAITILSSLVFVSYGVVNLILGKLIPGFIEIIVGVIGVSINLYLLIVKKEIKIPAILLNTLAILLSVYLYIDGGFHQTGIFWILGFPALFISTLGKKLGAIWMGLHIGIIVVLFIASTLDVITIAYDGITTFSVFMVYIFTCYILFTYEIYRRRYKKEIDKLEGLLPICSYCKKIKSDEGSWQSVDSYLTRKADMDFSHGICPDCMKEVYPDYYERMQKK